jgi:hypothetical protein
MTSKKKRSNPSSNNEQALSPRRGEKSKQTKIAETKDTEAKGAKQTKLAFGTTPTPENPKNAAKGTRKVQHKLSFASAVTGTPTNTNSSPPPNTTAITPEGAAGANRLTPTSLPNSPERQDTTTKTAPHNDDHEQNDAANKKPAAKKSKPKQRSLTTTPSTAEPDLTRTSTQYRIIRYSGQIDTPPSEKPFDSFFLLLKEYFKIIQDILGKTVHIAAWDNEQELSFPPITSPSTIPKSRESLGIYLGTYVNPKADGSRVYLKLRLLSPLTHPVPLSRFGIELSDHFRNSEHRLSMTRQPQPCQATKSSCVGWLMYSCKSMNSETFVPAIKKTLKIPDEVAIGIQYRTISNETGKKPAFNREDPPAAAIHLDIDERYALIYQARAASLWRKNSKKRLPNGVQLRLIPCFTSATGKSMTETQRSDAKTLTERQYYFVKAHLQMLPPYYFISQLDTPLGPDQPMTLRRAIMSRSPKNHPTSRLIHNVDPSWNQTTKHMITTVVGKEIEAQRFLVNMIPEFLHQFGEAATKWFTSSGLIVYQDVKWNPEKGNTTSAKEQESEEMVKEDVWDLNDKWKEICETKTTDNRPETSTIDQAASTTDQTGATKATSNTDRPRNRLLRRLALQAINLLHHSATPTNARKTPTTTLQMNCRQKKMQPSLLTSLAHSFLSTPNKLKETDKRPSRHHFQLASQCPLPPKRHQAFASN